MPAKIVVLQGPNTGQEYWIERSPARLGSDPSLEICLGPASPGRHCATLEYNGGRYVLYNRSPAPFDLEGQAVAPQSSAVWANRQRLRLGPLLVVGLSIDGNPAPARQPLPAVTVDDFDVSDEDLGPGDDNSADAAVSPPAAPRRTKQAIQVVVTVVCFLGVGLMLMTAPQPGGAERPPEAVRDEFAGIVKDLGEVADQDHRDLALQLQAARSAEIRGEWSRARMLYNHTLARLIRARDGQDHSSDVDRRCEAFVLERINVLPVPGGTAGLTP
jgi:hypothetical protein